MRVIVNTSPLIVLDRIGRLDLLRSLYGRVVRPASVLEELRAGARHDSRRKTLEEMEWIVTEPDPPEMALRKELGDGETAVITLGFRTKADLLILDDLQARLVAQQLGLRVTGTLGVLVAAHKAGFLNQLAGTFEELERAGFRITQDLKAALLES